MIVVDPSGAIAPYEQVRSQIADLIRAGELAANVRLPSIRQLAADLRIAAGTVAKAYAALEADGLIETSRSRGTRVREAQMHSAQVRAAAAEFARAARGLPLDEVLGAVRAAWASNHG